MPDAVILMVVVFPREATTTAVVPSCFITVTGGTSSTCVIVLVGVGVTLLETADEVCVVGDVVVVVVGPSFGESCIGVGVMARGVVDVVLSTTF